jgi:uncharacterized protein (TIGR02757 family)
MKDTLDRLKIAHEARLTEAEAENRVIDPLLFPRRYAAPEDQEVAAFIAAGLAFGRISLFATKLEAIFQALGSSPRAGVLAFPARGELLPNFVYRFIRTEDLNCFIYLLGQMIRRSGSIEAFFLEGHKPHDLKATLASFVERALALPVDGFYDSATLPPDAGVRFFFSHPKTGASKRLCLFLRWMVRNEFPDLGVWKGLSPTELVIPLDTHIAQQARRLGWLTGSTMNFSAAQKVTERLKAWSPDDPLRYDFALCHEDIVQTDCLPLSALDPEA